MIPRVIGGEPVDPTERPFLLEVRSGGGPSFCGAFLLSASVALTAAHCVVPLPPLPLSVSSPACGYSTVTAHPHPSYDRSFLRHDIAILSLSTPFQSCLPSLLSVTRSPPVETALIAGHGSIDADSFVRPSSPHQARVPLVDDSVCEERWSYRREDGGVVSYVDPSLQICAGDASVDSCFGDSGSPLFVEAGSPGRIVVLGITSFGSECADAYYPAVYTRVSSYLDWINATIRTLTGKESSFRTAGLVCDCPSPLSPTCLSVSSSPTSVWSVCEPPDGKRKEVRIFLPSPTSLSLLLPHSVPFHGDVLPSRASSRLVGDASFLPRGDSSSLPSLLLSLNASLLSSSSPDRETGCSGLEEGFQDGSCCYEEEDEVCLSAIDLYETWEC